jgi:hypothetical protein
VTSPWFNKGFLKKFEGNFFKNIMSQSACICVIPKNSLQEKELKLSSYANKPITLRGYVVAVTSLLILNMFLPAGAIAAPEEIEVYLDDFTEAGKIGLDLHTNYVASGQPETSHQFRVTPELSYGINNNWDAAAYFLTVKNPGESFETNGVKVRARWRPKAPSANSPFYWAVNFELGQLAKGYFEDQTSGEIKFIGTWRNDSWVLGMNLNLDRAMKSNPVQAASSEFDTKIAYKIKEGFQLGIENYSFLGAMRNNTGQNESLNQPQSSRANYLVADFGVGKWDFNVGIGHVTGQSPDKTVLKAIIGVPL